MYVEHAATSKGLIATVPTWSKIDKTYAIVVTVNETTTRVTLKEGKPRVSCM